MLYHCRRCPRCWRQFEMARFNLTTPGVVASSRLKVHVMLAPTLPGTWLAKALNEWLPWRSRWWLLMLRPLWFQMMRMSKMKVVLCHPLHLEKKSLHHQMTIWILHRPRRMKKLLRSVLPNVWWTFLRPRMVIGWFNIRNGRRCTSWRMAIRQCCFVAGVPLTVIVWKLRKSGGTLHVVTFVGRKSEQHES